MAGYCEQDNKPSGPIKSGEIHRLSEGIKNFPTMIALLSLLGNVDCYFVGCKLVSSCYGLHLEISYSLHTGNIYGMERQQGTKSSKFHWWIQHFCSFQPKILRKS
jgi:hypothetical protein